MKIDVKKSAMLPLGIELQPNSLELALKLHDEGLIDHVQISAPAAWDSSILARVPRDLPIIVHSLFLNVLGENDWKLLESAGERIKTLRPLAVVEHFGVAIDRSGRKHAVSFDLDPAREAAQVKLAVANLKRWKRLLGRPVYLENLPFARGIGQYLAAYRRTAEVAGTPCSVDLPHLLVSFNADGRSFQSTLDGLADMAPEHVHIGGVLCSSERVEDNHLQISPWLLKALELAGVKPRMITLEQSDRLPDRYVEEKLRQIQRREWGRVPELDRRKKTRTSGEFSEYLASGRARAWGVSTARRHSRRRFKSKLLDAVESQYPYVYPLASMKAASASMEVGDAVESLAKVLQLAKDFGSWYFGAPTEKFYLRVSRGRVRHHLDFDGEMPIERVPRGARKQYTIRTIDKSMVEVFASAGEKA